MLKITSRCLSNILTTQLRCASTTASTTNLAKLRKETGYSLSLCRKALNMAEDDPERAKSWLKENISSQTQKVVMKEASHGLIGLMIRNNLGIMAEVNCETDFVSRNEIFQTLVKDILNALQKNAVSSDKAGITHLEKFVLDELLAKNENDLSESLTKAIGQLQENVILSRACILNADKSGKVHGVTHPNVKISDDISLGRFGVLVEYHSEQPEVDQENVESVGKHIIGFNPTEIGQEDFDAERKKPEEEEDNNMNALESGEESEESFGLSEPQPNELLRQKFLYDQTQTVGEYLREQKLSVNSFVRFELGAH